MITNEELWNLPFVPHLTDEQRLELRGRLGEAEDILAELPDEDRDLLSRVLPDTEMLQGHGDELARRVAIYEARVSLSGLGEAALAELLQLLRNPEGVVCRAAFAGLVASEMITSDTVKAIRWCREIDE